MADDPFFRTRMGQRYYEQTLPELVRQLTRLNDLLERALAPAPSAGADAPPRRGADS